MYCAVGLRSLGVAASSLQATLPFVLQAKPRGQVTIDFQASLPGGVAEIEIPSETQARRRMNADNGLVFSPSNFKTPSDVIIKVRWIAGLQMMGGLYGMVWYMVWYMVWRYGMGYGMGWDGMVWYGMGYGMGYGMVWDGMGWDGMGWDGMGWDGMGWDGMGWFMVWYGLWFMVYGMVVVVVWYMVWVMGWDGYGMVWDGMGWDGMG